MQNIDFISASIVTYNDGEEAAEAVKSLNDCTNRYPLKLYVVDNSPNDETAKAVSKVGGATLLSQHKNLGFGAAHNKVLSEELGKYHFIVNPDIKINSDVLSDMVDVLETNPDILLACPKICNPDGSEQKLPKLRPTAKRLFLGRLSSVCGAFKKIREDYILADREITEITDIDFCTGCFCVIRTDAFKKLGGFDERYFMYLEDADLTLRAKNLGRTVMIPSVSVTHAWHRDSAKKLKYLMIHLNSSIKFLIKWRKNRL